MTLVRTLHGATLRTDLQRAHVALSRALLEHRGGARNCAETSDSVALDAIVGATELPVDLRAVRNQCDLVTQDEERPIEIFNNLGHMFVLLQAAIILSEDCGLTPLLCAPTQQSEHEGRRMFDLEGDRWVLEAFGGVDVTNNGKLAKDLRRLAQGKTAGKRAFLALREVAWPGLRKLPDGTRRSMPARCSRPHGGPFQMDATVQRIGRRHGVTVLEADAITLRSAT